MRKGLVLVAAVGWVLLGLIFMLGASWSQVGRAGQVRVRNETSSDFKALFLGSDFRRNQRIGDLDSGATSAPLSVDLENPATFNALEGRAGDRSVRHTLSSAEASSLEAGAYTWVVRDEGDSFAYEFHRD
jgi:hypothetical protein